MIAKRRGPLVNVAWLSEWLGIEPNSSSHPLQQQEHQQEHQQEQQQEKQREYKKEHKKEQQAVESHNPRFHILDGTWFLPALHGRESWEGRTDFHKAHIPHAKFFDLDDFSATNASNLPHMLAKREPFVQKMKDELGIDLDSNNKDADGDFANRNEVICVYDSIGVFSAPRVWWVLKAMAHPRFDIVLLDGGLPAWKSASLPTVGESSPPSHHSSSSSSASTLPLHDHLTSDTKSNTGSFTRRVGGCYLATESDIMQIVNQQRHVETTNKDQPGYMHILDARGPPRFKGEVPEPRPGLRSGHMPGAYNLPFEKLLKHETPGGVNEVFKQDHEIEQVVFRDVLGMPCDCDHDSEKEKNKEDLSSVSSKAKRKFAELQRSENGASDSCNDSVTAPRTPRIVTSCGSGTTAAVLTFALEVCGIPSALYDGSWTEYAQEGKDTPVVTST